MDFDAFALLIHLAGALGVGAWLPLSTCSDWRWMRGRDDSPWYPSVRLFRQTKRGDWAEVFARIAEQLRKQVAGWSARQPLLVEVGAGELVDKITILEIKLTRIADPAKRHNIAVELEALLPAYHKMASGVAALAELKAELKAINEELWDVEDGIRDCERKGDHGSGFVGLARSVYHTNDRRAEVKRQINALAGSRIVEEKAYHWYSTEKPTPKAPGLAVGEGGLLGIASVAG